MTTPLSKFLLCASFLLGLSLLSIPAEASYPWDEPATCERHDECANGGTCVNGECLAPGLPYDGGADAVCGPDRRCRIDRLAARNQLRRQYEVAQYQQIVDQELVRIGEEEDHPNPRLNKPRLFGLTVDTLGVGVMGGWNFHEHFRLSGYLKTDDERIAHTYHDPVFNAPISISERQSLTAWGVSIAYLSTTRIISPLALAGFTIASGELGVGWSSNPVADVEYHFFHIGAGLDLQLSAGFQAQLTYNLQWLLHNQATLQDGGNNAELGRLLSDYYSNSRGLSGFALTFGLAF